MSTIADFSPEELNVVKDTLAERYGDKKEQFETGCHSYNDILDCLVTT